MRNLLFGTAAVAALALAFPAMAQEKPSGTGHCAKVVQNNCVDKDPPVGWNEGQVWACQTSLDGSGNVFQYAYWTNGEYWWVENIRALGDLLVQGCDSNTDRSQFVYVTNGSTGAFNGVQNRIPGY